MCSASSLHCCVASLAMVMRLLILTSNWYNLVIAALWIILIIYLILMAASAKRTVGRGRVWWREIGLRLLILGGVLIALRLFASNQALPEARSDAVNSNVVNSNMLLGTIGAALCALGVGFTIWARAYLGRNWGMPMSQKENPEVITTGPYACVRHPIYAGFLLAMLGSAIGQTVIWLVPLVIVGAYFVYSARREEKLMLEQFPEQYRAYMQRTKMLVPFIW